MLAPGLRNERGLFLRKSEIRMLMSIVHAVESGLIRALSSIATSFEKVPRLSYLDRSCVHLFHILILVIIILLPCTTQSTPNSSLTALGKNVRTALSGARPIFRSEEG